MPIHKVTHIGIENLYMTQPMPQFDPSQGMSRQNRVAERDQSLFYPSSAAVHNYGNMAPESAMHGIVFRFAESCWVRNISTFMTGKNYEH